MPRREKRRHSTESTFDERDPIYILLLAVQMDETINPDWLDAPLRYYGNRDDYKRALAYLSKGGNTRKQPPPTTPLTPIILSGLIAEQQAREQEGAAANSNTKKGTDTIEWIPAPELVSCCMTMRKNSLERLARKRRTRKLRIAALLVAIGFVCGLAYHQTITSMERNMIELGYVGLLPCARIGIDEAACRSAEAAVWAYFRDYSSSYSAKLRDCTRRKCSRDSRNIMRRQLSSIHSRASDIEYGQGPYAMHTIATREDVVLKSALSKSSFEPWWAPHEEDGSRIKKGLQWLGDSTVNQLVRKRLLKAMKNQKGATKSSFCVLDIGCGIGGTLYALAGAAEDRWHDENEFSRIDYTGIAISSAEITNARRLAAEHEMDPERMRFQQVSFDNPALREHGKFSAALAIESLSFSKDISVTLSNLASVIQSGGMLIVVDDVVRKQVYKDDRNNNNEESVIKAYSELASRPSLLTHTEWKEAFDRAGFVMTEAMDIGLHFALPQLVEDGSDHSRRSSFKSWLLRAVRRSKQPSVFLSLLQKWEAWIRSRMGDVDMEPDTQVANEKLAQLQAIQLMQQNVKFIRSKALRKRGHEKLDLTYNMYVCTKR